MLQPEIQTAVVTKQLSYRGQS